jgi:hypothetical protein
MNLTLSFAMSPNPRNLLGIILASLEKLTSADLRQQTHGH